MPNIPFGLPMISEEERSAVLEVLSTPILVHGPRSTSFETEFAAYTGAAHAIAVSSCTAGMHLIWFSLGIGPGDEVIVPAQTHVATAHAVELTGAKAVFVDAEARTGNMNLEAMESAITERTRAIAIVHFLGMPIDMGKVMAIAKKRSLFVLEDCALAIGSRLDGKHAGTLGDCGVFSFYPVKHITTAEGGMVTTADANLAKALRLKKAFGVDRTHGERKVPGYYDVVTLGLNYRMNEIQAAIGIQQVRKIDGFFARRKQNYETLATALSDISELSLLESTGGRYQSSYYCLSAILDPKLAPRRAEIMSRLTELGIGTSIYYPQPVPRMTYYREKYGFTAAKFPQACRISDSSIAFPVGPHLTPEHMLEIARAAKSAIQEYKQ